jgi:DNA polymerase-4
MHIMRALCPVIEQASVDEAYADISGTLRIFGPPENLARRLKAEILSATKLTCSVGIAPNKFLAKIASDLDKPRGFSVIGEEGKRAFLAPRPVTAIWGIGAAFARRLSDDGLRTVGDIQSADPAVLARRYGAMGLRMARLAVGDDERTVDPGHRRKSVGAETTFDTDIADHSALRPIIRRLSEKVAARLKADHIAGTTVTLKLKTADFRLATRARRLADPTQLADRIFQAADDLLSREPGGPRYRLVGVQVSDLEPDTRADPADLVDVRAGKAAAAERAMDAVRAKFGRAAVETGLVFGDRIRRGR